MCDAFIFIYIGLGLFAFGKSQTTYNPGFIVCALVSLQPPVDPADMTQR